jgi:hypothetical protein
MFGVHWGKKGAYLLLADLAIVGGSCSGLSPVAPAAEQSDRAPKLIF